MGYPEDQDTKIYLKDFKKMNKIIVAVAGCIIMLGCRANQPEGKVQDMLSIKNLSISAKQLEFDYTIKNSYPMAIWLCEDIDAYNDKIRVSISASKKQVLISLKSFDVPMHILLEAPIWTKYTRLASGGTYNGKIFLSLPLSSISPLDFTDERTISANINVEQLVFEVGYFTEDLGSKVSDSIEQDESEKTVYVSHLWEDRKKEQITTASIASKKIPCYVSQK
jgi:hypothetical protein